MIDFDVSRRPGPKHEWEKLLYAVVGSTASDEKPWLECKSEYRWSVTSDVAKLSRAILAMANRMPEDAAPYMGGSGVVIVGLEPGSIHGVELLDPTDLENKLATFIGDHDAPGWTPHWLVLDDKNVLIVEVSPPRQGDPPWVFRGTSNNLVAGQVFVRNGTKSVPASQALMDRLSSRVVPVAPPDELLISVSIEPNKGLPRCFWTERSVNELIARERQSLMQSLESHQAREAADHEKAAKAQADKKSNGFRNLLDVQNFQITVPTSYLLQTEEPEPRRPEQYVVEVERYLRSLRESIPEQMDRTAAVVLDPIRIRVTNRTGTNYENIELTIRVAGRARALDHSDYEPRRRLEFAGRPRTYGPYPKPHPITWAREQYATPTADGFPMVKSLSRRNTTNGGSFTHEIVTFDLRAHKTDLLVEDELVLVVPPDRTEPVVVEWEATASNRDAIAHGSLVLEFDGEPVDLLAAALR